LFILDPDPDFLHIPDLGAGIQGSKRHRIPDPDPQHCQDQEKKLEAKRKEIRKMMLFEG
jgi:hypothetical protein